MNRQSNIGSFSVQDQLSDRERSERNVTSFLKGVRLWMILLLLLISLPYTQAIGAPASMIVDKADLFQDQEREALETLSKAASFDLYVYTLMQVENKEINFFAERMFKDWELDGDDLLLVVAIEDGDAYLQAKMYGDLRNVILADRKLSGANKYKALLDTTFIPYAENGQFAEGITELLYYVDGLFAAEGEALVRDVSSQEAEPTIVLNEKEALPEVPVEQPVQTSISTTVEQPLVTAAPTADDSPVNDQAVEKQKAAFKPLPYLILVVLVIVLFFVVFGRQTKKTRQKIVQMKESLEDTKNQLYVLNQELPPLIALARGQSREHLQTIRLRFEQGLQDASTYTELLYLITSKTKIRVADEVKARKLEENIRQLFSDITQLTRQMDDYRKLVRRNTELLRYCDTELKDLEYLVKQRRDEQRYVAPGLLNGLSVQRSQWEQAERDHTFDPMRSYKKTTKLNYQIGQLRAEWFASL